GFDAYGNVTSETDPTGATTLHGYDAGFHVFPVNAINALGHVTTFAFDPVCGALLATVDPNLAQTAWSYDALCRPISETGPLGATTKWSYPGLGDPASQRVAITQSSADGVHPINWTGFFDGLGRTYREV